MTIGERLREYRLSKKMTQVELSRLSGVKQATISALENGYNSPTTPTLEMLSKALDCTVSDLLGESKLQMAPPDDLDDALVRMMMDLSPDEAQRVRDFVAGLKSARKG